MSKTVKIGDLDWKILVFLRGGKYIRWRELGYENMMAKSKNEYRWHRQNIKALRAHLGLTQNEMAKRLGTRQQTISEWELGMYQPRGASATLLSIVAEQARFKYDATPPDENESKKS